MALSNDPASTNAGKQPNPKSFNHRLESLRGVAALIVAVYHCFLVLVVKDVLPGTRDFQNDVFIWASSIFNGSAAVVLFFVLSGYVLGLSLDRIQHMSLESYLRYAVSRVLRIWPAYVVSVLIVLAYLGLNYKHVNWPFASVWFNGFYAEPLNAKLIFKDLFMIGSKLNSNTWTLKIEIICSLLLPFFHPVARRVNRIADLCLLACMPIVSYLTDNPYPIYMALFYFGLVIPKWASLFHVLKEKGIGSALFYASAVLLCLFTSGATIGSTTLGIPLGIFAFLLIGLLATDHGKAYQWLDTPILMTLGQVSYSFYLIQFVILYIVSTLLFNTLSTDFVAQNKLMVDGIIILADVTLSYYAAKALYNWVEKPSIQLSKALKGKRPETSKPSIQELHPQKIH